MASQKIYSLSLSKFIITLIYRRQTQIKNSKMVSTKCQFLRPRCHTQFLNIKLVLWISENASITITSLSFALFFKNGTEEKKWEHYFRFRWAIFGIVFNVIHELFFWPQILWHSMAETRTYLVIEKKYRYH